jgi:hypothetical protein
VILAAARPAPQPPLKHAMLPLQLLLLLPAASQTLSAGTTADLLLPLASRTGSWFSPRSSPVEDLNARRGRGRGTAGGAAPPLALKGDDTVLVPDRTAIPAAAKKPLDFRWPTSSPAAAGQNFSIVLGDQVFFGTSDVPEVHWAETRVWQRLLSVTADETVTTAGLVRANQKGWRTVLAVNSDPVELQRRAASKKRPPTNLSEVIGLQLDDLPLTWEYLCEDDSSGTGFSYDLLQAARKSIVETGAQLEPATVLALWEDYLGAAYNATARHVLSRRQLTHRNAKFGFPSSAHSIAKSGANTLVLERTNDDVGSLAVGLAFLRGAAAQYGINWGVDLSLWWGVVGGCVQDLPASLHTRALFMAYMSGAALVEIEGCGWLDEPAHPGGAHRPLPISDAVDEFGKFATHVLPPAARGTPDVVVAVILPNDSGWNERPSWADRATSWNYADLPARRGSRSIDGFFSASFPGTDRFTYYAFPFGAFADGGVDDPASPFARSAITPKYAPDPTDVHYAEPPIPFGVFASRKNASKYMKATRRDPSRFRPMVDTRWGAIIDVMVAPASTTGAVKLWEAVQQRGQYSVLVFLASTMSATTAAAMHDFARNGGTVVVAVGTVLPDHATVLTGVDFSGIVLASRSWQYGTDSPVHEPLLLAEATIVDDTNTSVLARSLPTNAPLVAKRRLGHGTVYTCAVPFFEGGGRDLSQLALRLLDNVIGEKQPVVVNGLPLEWTSTTRPDGGKIIALSNHAEGPSWTGSLAVRMPSDCRVQSCRELRQNTTCTAHRDGGLVRVSLTIAPFDVAVIDLACRGVPTKSDDGAARAIGSASSANSSSVETVAIEFSGGAVSVNLVTGAYVVQTAVDGLQILRGAHYELWWNGRKVGTKDSTLLLINWTQGVGEDALGKYRLIELQWQVGDTPPATAAETAWTTGFKAYSAGPLVFVQSFPQGWNGKLSSRADIDVASSGFPAFELSHQPDLRMATFRGQNAAQSTHRGQWPKAYRGGYLGGPICLMTQALDGAVLLSPLNEFMVTEHYIKQCDDQHSPQPGNCTTLVFGIAGLIESLPPTTALEFIMHVDVHASDPQPRAGVVAGAFMRWGDTLLQRHGRRRPPGNVSAAVSHLGYSTTGIYHYNPCDCVDNRDEERCNSSNPYMPNCRTYEDTLLAVLEDAKSRNLPYGWLLIDSWWHAFDHEEYFEDVPQQVGRLFPHSLKWLSQTTNMRFGAHWSANFGPTSPYRSISPESWFCAPDNSACIPTSEAVWDHIFASDLSWKLETIKIDHMLNTLVGSAADNGDGTCPGPRGWPHPGHECTPGERTRLILNKSQAVIDCLTSPTVAQDFLTAVARSAERHGVGIEWCMSYPNVLMHSVTTGQASTHARGSDDSHPVGAGTADGKLGYTSNNWRGFAGESTFLWAVGLWPFKDTFYSNSSATPLNKHAEDYLGLEPRPFTHALVSALGGGGVANGDPVGYADYELLMLTCDKEGALLKPTVPAMYIDRSWLLDPAVGETAVAIVTVDALSWRMIYTINNTAEFTLTPEEVGIRTVAGRHHVVYAYCGPRPLTRAGCLQPGVRGGSVQYFDNTTALRVSLPTAEDLEAQYFVVAPVVGGKWSLLGEWPKLVAVSGARFVSVSATASLLEVELIGVGDETVDVVAARVPGLSNLGSRAGWVLHSVSCDFGASGGIARARWRSAGNGTSDRVVATCDVQ